MAQYLHGSYKSFRACRMMDECYTAFAPVASEVGIVDRRMREVQQPDGNDSLIGCPLPARTLRTNSHVPKRIEFQVRVSRPCQILLGETRNGEMSLWRIFMMSIFRK